MLQTTARCPFPTHRLSNPIRYRPRIPLTSNGRLSRTSRHRPRLDTRGRKSRDRTWQRHQDEPLGEHTKEAYTCTWRRTAEATPTKSLAPRTAATNAFGGKADVPTLSCRLIEVCFGSSLSRTRATFIHERPYMNVIGLRPANDHLKTENSRTLATMPNNTASR